MPDAWSYALTTVGMILFWTLVVFGAILLVHYLGRENRPAVERTSAKSTNSIPFPGPTLVATNTHSVSTDERHLQQPSIAGRPAQLVVVNSSLSLSGAPRRSFMTTATMSPTTVGTAR
jgi:hypothetical protein